MNTVETADATGFFPAVPSVDEFYAVFMRIMPLRLPDRLAREIRYVQDLGALLPWERYEQLLLRAGVPHVRRAWVRDSYIAARSAGAPVIGSSPPEDTVARRAAVRGQRENAFAAQAVNGPVVQARAVNGPLQVSNSIEDSSVISLLRSAAEQRTYEAAVETPASDLQARTVAEFMVLLRLLAKNSGANRNQLAKRAKLPTSTAYHLLSPSNGVLPTKGHQVTALVRACGLPNHQVDRVMRLWVELRDTDQLVTAADDTGTTRTTTTTTTTTTVASTVADDAVVVPDEDVSDWATSRATSHFKSRATGLLSRRIQVLLVALMVLATLFLAWTAFEFISGENTPTEATGAWGFLMSGPLTAGLAAAMTATFSAMMRRRLKV